MISKAKIQEVLDLNEKFYIQNAREFARTRGNFMQGWNKLLPLIKKGDKVLDIACGNGRFGEFLESKQIEYTGVDSNEFLLAEASKNTKGTFKKLNVFKDEIKGKYDIVTAFGILHHIPGTQYRLEWLKKIAGLTTGYLIVTTWQLNNDKRFKKALEASDLEENDYYYGWGDTNTKRYVHIYSNEEIENIVNNIGLKLCETYGSDGKSDQLNKYFIFSRF